MFRASHPLLTAKDGAPSLVVGYAAAEKVGHPPELLTLEDA